MTEAPFQGRGKEGHAGHWSSNRFVGDLPVTGVRGKQIAPKPYEREKSFRTSQWIPGENVIGPGPLLHPLIPLMSVVLVTASADQESDSKVISKNV